jgi:hypothetical protein
MYVDKVLAALADAPKLAYGTWFDRHLGCGCTVGHLALKAGIPPEDLIALDNAPTAGRPYAGLGAIIDRVDDALRVAYGIADEHERDTMFEWNDNIEGETPTQRAERMRALLPSYVAEYAIEQRLARQAEYDKARYEGEHDR